MLFRSDALARLHAMVLERLADPTAFARWFGAYNSTPKNPDIDWSPETPVSAHDLRRHLSTGEALHRNPASRFSFVRQADGGVLLFVDGECFECAGEAGAFAEQLCAGESVALDPAMVASDEVVALLVQLTNQGILALSEAD